MKKEILSAIGIIAGILFGTPLSLSEQGLTALPMEVSAFRAVISLFSCPTPLRENWYPAVSPISPG